MNYYIVPGLRRDIDHPSVDRVVMAVCAVMNLSPKSLMSRRRMQPIPQARFICWYILRVRSMMTLKELGRLFGKRDHTSVIHGIATIKGYMEVDNGIKDLIATINSKLC